MTKINNRGYTLLEMMIVIAIIGLLATLALPNYIRARQTAQRDACISNLKQIQGAIQTWAIDAGAASSATFTTADIVSSYLKSWPKEGTAVYPVPENISVMPLCPNYDANTDHTL